MKFSERACDDNIVTVTCIEWPRFCLGVWLIYGKFLCLDDVFGLWGSCIEI